MQGYTKLLNDLRVNGFTINETSKKAYIFQATKKKQTFTIKYYYQGISGTTYGKITHWAARLGLTTAPFTSFVYVDDPNGKIPSVDLKVSQNVASRYCSKIIFKASEVK